MHRKPTVITGWGGEVTCHCAQTLSEMETFQQDSCGAISFTSSFLVSPPPIEFVFALLVSLGKIQRGSLFDLLRSGSLTS